MGVSVAPLIYLLNHSPLYKVAHYLSIVIGFAAIITNAVASTPPHIEITYLILLPLMGTLLLALHKHYCAQAEQESKQLVLDLDHSLPATPGNLDDLRAAFNRLIDNALRFSEAGDQITLRTRQENGAVIVAFVDTGNGISPEDLLLIFTPFFRVDRNRSTETGGMGLGLAIVERIVKLHGGSIRAESVVGQGSSFTLRLPLN
jgi:two-component system sensor histidine kinase BaeS